MQEDIPAILRYLNESHEFLAPSEPIQPTGFQTKQYWRDQVARSFQQFQSGQSLRLFLFEKTSPKTIIGTANFTNFVYYPFYCCHLGYGLTRDYQGQGLMQEALEELMKNRTTIIIAHRLATIRKADKIYVLDKGNIAESGTHEELLDVESGVYGSLVRLQMAANA